MGCGNSREVGVEESILVYAEGCLNLSKIDVDLLDISFRKYNHNGVVNQSQLIQISQNLGFRILNNKIHINIQRFFKALHQDKGYQLKDLLLICILLGKGKVKKKSSLIYEIFDEHFSHQLEIETIKKELLERMFRHSISTLPLLVVDSQLSSEDRSKHFRRLKKLSEVVPFACETLARSLCIRGKIISVETFNEVFSENPSLVTPSGLRNYLEKARTTFKKSLIDGESV
jgi:hypothetical protein